MREVGQASKDVNDRYTHVLIEAHLAAAEQTAALGPQGWRDVMSPGVPTTFPSGPESVDDVFTIPGISAGEAGGAAGTRTQDRRIMSPLL